MARLVDSLVKHAAEDVPGRSWIQQGGVTGVSDSRRGKKTAASATATSSKRGRKKAALVATDDDGVEYPALQGPLPAVAESDLPPLVLPSYPTVIEQARRNMRRFENCVLLTRVGGFYELYFGQAEEYGPLLNLKVGHKKTSLGPVPMVS